MHIDGLVRDCSNSIILHSAFDISYQGALLLTGITFNDSVDK